MDLFTRITLTFALWEWKCYTVRIQRGLVFPAVDPCALKAMKQDLLFFFSAQGAGLCACITL